MISVCKTINALTEDKFLAKAWADYLQAVNDNWSNFICLLTEASTYEREEGESISSAVNSLVTKYGYDGAESVTLSDGYSTVNDLVTYALEQTELYGDPSDPNASQALLESNLQLLTNAGSLSSKSISLVEVFDQVKTSLHSSTVLQAALESLDGETVSDRLTVFKDTVQSRFTNVFDDISASFQTFMGWIGTGFTTVSDFLNKVFTSLGVEEQAGDDSFTVNQSDVHQYTGASPLPTINFYSATSIVVGIGKVVGQAVYSIARGLAWIRSKIFSWAWDKTEKAIVPYDLEVKDEDAVGYTIDGWGVTKVNQPITLAINQYTSELADFVNTLAGRWYKLNFISCEFMFKVNSAELDAYNKIVGYYDYVLKPKPIKPTIFKQALYRSGWTVGPDTPQSSGDGYTWFLSSRSFSDNVEMDDALANLLNLLKESDYRPEVGKDPELDVFNSFLMGYQFSEWILGNCFDIITASDETAISSRTASFDVKTGDENTITNTDWVRLASGWNGQYGSSSVFTTYVPLLGTNLFQVEDIVSKMVRMFVFQQQDKQNRPMGYIFLPYRNDVASFDNSKYGIKTDADNVETLNKFIYTVAAIVIITTVAIFTGVKIQQLRRSLFFKKLEYVSQLDSAMWSGTRLSDDQRARYVRYSRRLNASSLLTGGLQESTSNAFSGMFNSSDTRTNTSLDQLYNDLLKLIKG